MTSVLRLLQKARNIQNGTAGQTHVQQAKVALCTDQALQSCTNLWFLRIPLDQLTSTTAVLSKFSLDIAFPVHQTGDVAHWSSPGQPKSAQNSHQDLRSL